MNMSFQEKSIWVHITLTLLIFGFYFTNALRVFLEPETPTSQLIPLFIGAVILFPILEAALHIVLATAFTRQVEAGEDERDRLIELTKSNTDFLFRPCFRRLDNCHKRSHNDASSCISEFSHILFYSCRNCGLVYATIPLSAGYLTCANVIFAIISENCESIPGK